MLLGWFDARKATEIGVTLADDFASATAERPAKQGRKKSAQQKPSDALREFLQRAEREARELRLNFYKKAKLANSFRWRLLEKGIEGAVAAEVTQTLVMHLSMNRLASVTGRDLPDATTDRLDPRKANDLIAQGAQYVAQGSYAQAIAAYQAFLKLKPRDASALNNLGVALCRLGHFAEAEGHFRRAIGIKPNYPDVHGNLGAMFRERGLLLAAEKSLRRALKLNPRHVDARINLGLTMLAAGRPGDAKVHLEKALKAYPAHVGALLGLGQIASTAGRFDEAEAVFRRVLEVNPNEPSAWAGLAGLRKMTSSDSAWLERARELIAVGISPPEEANLRFAMGKYCDDIADYAAAFQNYKRANELTKAPAKPYDRDARARFVDDLMRIYTPEAVAQQSTAVHSASSSRRPVLVVGMPRSGTSLVEQIIASHPSAAGAGELLFWASAMHRHETTIRRGTLNEPLRKEFAEAYLRELATHSTDAPRIVDKTPANSDFLGVIHSVFPNARIIYMRRHPIDTCLSCYFQQFAATMDFTMDLADLAHYYQQHNRLIAHWRTALPPGTILDVPYAELVADQEGWTRKILEFVGLEWDERCLNFQNAQRMVATASAWQVRQKIYKHSIERWRNYEKFIGPLRDLPDLNW